MLPSMYGSLAISAARIEVSRTNRSISLDGAAFARRQELQIQRRPPRREIADVQCCTPFASPASQAIAKWRWSLSELTLPCCSMQTVCFPTGSSPHFADQASGSGWASVVRLGAIQRPRRSVVSPYWLAASASMPTEAARDGWRHAGPTPPPSKPYSLAYVP